MIKNSNEIDAHYDIIIMGGGIAGLSACRHMLLKIPDLCKKRVAIIEPRNGDRDNKSEDFKVGESTIEISGMFLSRELELQDYLIENHPPKFSLQFHWPKKTNITNTMDDYYSTWSINNPDIQAFQLNRSKLEKDLLKMVIDQGAVYYHGRVKEIDLNYNNEDIKWVQIQLLNNNNSYDFESVITFTSDYLVDASGRNFTIGSRTNNLLKDPKDLFGIDNGSTWVRVKNIDKSLFNFNSPNVTSSWYYATNHFFGNGYWIWMIPLERGSRDLSIGICYHKDKIDPSQLNSLDKFLNFLEKNQKILFNLVKSGEIVDCHKWPRLAHTSKVFYSPDNWCVLGDAAAVFDPFYSTGIGMIAVEVECLTELIRLKLSGNDDLVYRDKVFHFNKFIKTLTTNNCHLIKKHSDHLGNASIMSWRIFLESTNYFGIDLPAYLGKYFLCNDFINIYADETKRLRDIRDKLLSSLDDINLRSINIGLMDNHKGGELIGSNWSPILSWDYDNALGQCKFDYKRLNLPKYLVWTTVYNLLSYTQLYSRAYGWKFFFNSSYIYILSTYLSRLPGFTIGSWIHWYQNLSIPNNKHYQMIKDDFLKNYKYETSIPSHLNK